MAKGFTETELYDIETAIYNDRNDLLTKALYEALPQDVMEDHNQENIKALVQGQEYYILPDTDILVRQDGRVFNAKFLRSLKPMWTPTDLITIVNRKSIRYSDIYKLKNWEFKQKEICKRYTQNNWPISVTSGYRETFKELYGT